jgi:two-component system chemotaxis sensor kinase CheA
MARAHSRSLRADSIPAFPGATFAVGAEGAIEHAWLGPASPVAASEGDLLAALDVDDASADAARVQLLLAQSCGAIASAWPMIAADAPTLLIRRDGRALAMLWQPIVAGGRIASVAAFVIGGEPLRVEADDPVERNRVCVDALGLVDECDGSLRHLRSEPEARHAIHRMFRAVHTIKGSTRANQMRAVHQLAHEIEEMLDVLRGSDGAVAAATLDHLERELHRLRGEITTARPRGEVDDDAMTELAAECRPALAELRGARAGLVRRMPESIAAAQLAMDRIGAAAERANMRALRVQCTASANAVRMIDESGFDPELIVEIDALDRHVELYQAVYREVAATDAGPATLVTLSRWLDAPDDRSGTFDSLADVMATAGISALVAAFVDPDPYAMRRALAVLTDAPAMFEPARRRDDASLRFERAQRDLLAAVDRLACKVPASLGEVRAIVQRMVWTPLGVLARRMVRMTRTLGADLGKNVVAEIDLGDLLVAPEIGRVIGEILIHAVRNAADHGIESPAERAAARKAPTGTIRVEARAAGDRVIVVVSDDGRGIDVARVKQTAIARGLLPADTAANEAEILDVLFQPGFSTASSVTTVSGRGVGMDVIKCLAEEQGGHVILTSIAGRGTQLVLDLPFAPP